MMPILAGCYTDILPCPARIFHLSGLCMTYYNQIQFYCPLSIVWFIFPMRLNIDQIVCKYFPFSDMNGLLIAGLVIVLLFVEYLILQTIGCLWSRHNRIQRGTEGLPGLDSDQSPSTPWTVLGNILYWFYGLPCRLCCP